MRSRSERHGSGGTAASARRCGAPPSGPAWPCFRSNKHISAQIIDDRTGRTLAAASTTEADLRSGAGTAATAGKVGEQLAERAKAAGVTSVVFDRGGFLYHGRVAALADGARKGGLEF